MKRVKLFIPACGPMRHRVCMYVCMYVCGCAVLTSCTREDMNDIVPNISAGSGTSVAFSITLSDSPSFNGAEGETRSCHRGEPLISEWVKVNSFDATRPVNRSGGEPEKYSLALMELYEDSVSTANTPKTRSIMRDGFYFRVIAFRKTGTGPDDYVFQCAADYTSGGGSAPLLRQGNMILPIGQTYRFVAYSFNNDKLMGALPTAANCKWKDSTTAISISPMNSDFLTYDSGNISATDTNLFLTVSFRHMLCEMNVRISGTSFTRCQGVYIKGGGNATTWSVGSSEVTPNEADSYSSNIADNFQGQYWRLVPSIKARQMQVHISSALFEDIRVNNIDVTSSQPISLQAGMHYTMKLRFKLPGINVSKAEINLGGNSCTQEDKECLSRLKWADGNLKSTSNGNIMDYVWTSPTDYGYYYTWMSTYTGNTSRNGIDPCERLNPDIYGKGWRTPTSEEYYALTRCTTTLWEKYPGSKKWGRWFMNNQIGLFLVGSGEGSKQVGSTMGPVDLEGFVGFYWTSYFQGAKYGRALKINNGGQSLVIPEYSEKGCSVRCVKVARQ